jgi:DNA-binding response OmpR family regulator
MASDPEVRAACAEAGGEHLVITADGVSDGLEFLRTVDFDLAVVDYEFASQSAPLLLAAIRRSSPAVHRVVTSRRDLGAARALVVNQLADAYLTVADLRRELGAWLGHSKTN